MGDIYRSKLFSSITRGSSSWRACKSSRGFAASLTAEFTSAATCLFARCSRAESRTSGLAPRYSLGVAVVPFRRVAPVVGGE